MRHSTDIERAYDILGLTPEDRALLVQEVYDRFRRLISVYELKKPKALPGEAHISYFENVTQYVDAYIAQFANSSADLQQYVNKPGPTLASLADAQFLSKPLRKTIERAMKGGPNDYSIKTSLLWPLSDDSIRAIRLKGSTRHAVELLTCSCAYGVTNGFSRRAGSAGLEGWKPAANILTESGVFAKSQLGELAVRPALRQAMLAYLRSLTARAGPE
jgi:hypothetical protein